ncbi:MAG: hypothetical protein KF819_19080 [Labilithrix sp.]|nr:hypothetical protein [Labilithrix sp.]
MLRHSFLFACAVTLFACADAGAPPALSNLTLTPTTVDVNKQVMIQGDAIVEDADGDVSALVASITVPGGQTQQLAETALNANGATKAQVKVAIALALPAPGDYTLNVWVKDKEGNESAKLSQPITAK